MKKYYVTFGSQYAFNKSFVEISVTVPEDNEARAGKVARHTAFAHFGNSVSFIYREADFAGQEEKFGLSLLCRINATDFDTSIEYKKL